MIKVLKICGKTSDMCNIEFVDENNNVVGERDDYVPDYFPGEHYGDYIILDIDVETGVILNWKKPTQEQLKKSMSNESN